MQTELVLLQYVHSDNRFTDENPLPSVVNIGTHAGTMVNFSSMALSQFSILAVVSQHVDTKQRKVPYPRGRFNNAVDDN